jgi:hypothetical protein
MRLCTFASAFCALSPALCIRENKSSALRLHLPLVVEEQRAQSREQRALYSCEEKSSALRLHLPLVVDELVRFRTRFQLLTLGLRVCVNEVGASGQRVESREQRRVQSAECRVQRAEGRGQRAEGRGQRTECLYLAVTALVQGGEGALDGGFRVGKLPGAL